MVNFGLNAAAILGLVLAVAGAGLFFLRSIRPELARDYDIFFAAVGLLCGIILLFNGWRLDPILQFGQFLLTGTAIFFAFESIRLRSVATEQARRNTPTVDRDRSVGRTRVYIEAELDQIDPYDNYEDTTNYNRPRLRGYDDDPQTRSSRRPTETRRLVPAADIRDEPRRSSRNYDNRKDNYDSSNLSKDYDAELGRRYEEEDESMPGDYVVDYQPIEDARVDYSDDYSDESDERSIRDGKSNRPEDYKA